MPVLEGDEELKLESEETIAERVKLNPWEKKKRNRIKNLDYKQMINQTSILLARIKPGNNSCKLKNEKVLQQFNQVIIIMEGNMIVIRDPKIFYFGFDWPKDVDKNLIHEAEFIISNGSLAENKIKMGSKNYFPNISMETLFGNNMNMQISKMNESHKFVLNLSERLDLRNSNKHVALQNLSIYYTWKI